MAQQQPIPVEAKLLLSIEETASMLGVCRDLVFRLVLGPNPVLITFFIGRRRLVPRRAIDQFIEAQMQQKEQAS